MPLRPDFSSHRPDPRFDFYRERVGKLLRGDEGVGYLLVEVEPYSEHVSGHLWWRRWSGTQDILWLWTMVDGQFSDELVPHDASEDLLHAFDDGHFDYYGELLRLQWTSNEESQSLRTSQFGRQ